VVAHSLTCALKPAALSALRSVAASKSPVTSKAVASDVAVSPVTPGRVLMASQHGQQAAGLEYQVKKIPVSPQCSHARAQVKHTPMQF
jgi:hypothetical protein